METKNKAKFSNLLRSERFSIANEKLSLGVEMSYDELSYILCLALVFYDAYDKSSSLDYLEYFYYLILKYYLHSHDSRPLLTFSVNYGLYPIADVLLKESNKVSDILLEEGLAPFREGKIVEMLSQKRSVEKLLATQNKDRIYVAPTSYGKSTFIRKDLTLKLDLVDKIAIIVPKKVLIWETFLGIKKICREKGVTVLLHDTEYSGQDKFVGVFTQERALRLMSDDSVSFDAIYIDEAHNLFENDGYRGVLLARVVRIAKKRNADCQITYLSPLIDDFKNLRIKRVNSESVDGQRIDFNVKCQDVFYFDDDSKEAQKYSVFTGKYYSYNHNFSSWDDYLKKESKAKNLIYFNSPKDIERFVRDFEKKMDPLDDEEITKTIAIVKKYIDGNYLMVSALKKGIIFLHSKTPEFIKEYLIDCFKKNDKIRYIVSNSTIFEGINLPLDCLFVMNVFSLKEKTLVNLCGRINRLNSIFNEESDLRKLIVPLHFIKSSYSKEQNVKSKIELLRHGDKDILTNPMLENSKVKSVEDQEIIQLEDNLLLDNSDDNVRDILVKNGVNGLYKDFKKVFATIKTNISNLNLRSNDLSTLELINLLYDVFIKGLDYDDFVDKVLQRLVNEKARQFYRLYITSGIYYENIKSKIAFFKKIFDGDAKKNSNSYVGKSFGEIPLDETKKNPLYVDIRTKSKDEVVNLAVARSEEEDDFVDYTLGKLVKCLLDLKLIDEDSYNLFLYNSNDENTVDLMSMGFTAQVISFLKENCLIEDAIAAKNGGQITQKLKDAFLNADDLIRFEINKYF